MPNFPTLLLLLMVVGCTTTQKPDSSEENSQSMDKATELNENERIYWINSLRVPCTGEAPQRCLQVQYGEKIDSGNWEYFYSEIDGFAFEEGYIYQLVVREDDIPTEQVPADGSSIKYTMVQLLDKQVDPKLRLNDIWMLETLEGQSIDGVQLEKYPYLEFSLAEQRVVGHDGCNNLNGTIKQLDSTSLLLGPIATTRKMCPDMRVPDQFGRLLSKISTYKVENSTLYIYDDQESELMTLGKTD